MKPNRKKPNSRAGVAKEASAYLTKKAEATPEQTEHEEEEASNRKTGDEDTASTQTGLEMLRQVGRPKVAQLHDAVEANRHGCLVMEPMQTGEPFKEVIGGEQCQEGEVREAESVENAC